MGKPLVYHDKRPRNTFRDLKAELEDMIMNEVLWKIIDSLELSGKDYFDCYLEIGDGIERNIESLVKKFIEISSICR